MTILYADDDPDDCELLTEAVRHIDPSISCITANDGREALTLLHHSKRLPDTIILDVNMPIMNGKQCLMAIKNDPKLRSIPVVIYSTTSDQKEKAELQGLGALEFIHKASSFADLRRVMSQLIYRLQRVEKISR